jgi:hypothetical protein
LIERKPAVFNVRMLAKTECKMTRGRIFFAVTLLMGAAMTATAAPLPETMARLMAIMPGVYDTADQVAAETTQGVPEAQRHERRHVMYARIDAPHIGPHVFFRQTRADGPDGKILGHGLAVFEPDSNANGIRMWLRNIVTPERYTDLHLKKELWREVAFDPAYGGKCPFHWRMEREHLIGTLLGGGCKITSNAGKAMSFASVWVLTNTSLSIFDNTYDGDGKLMSGRADKVPTVYSKLP